MLERLATLAMGARFEVVLEARDRSHARAAGEAALEEIERCDARWSLFRSDSLVARVNREAGEREVLLDHETFELLAACAQLRERTLGAFDVALGVRMRELGFRGAAPSPGAANTGAASRAAATPAAACDDVPYVLSRATRSLRFTRSDVALDLGAIGKGEALDRAAQVLRECGIERALMHGGTSSVVALGAPPERAGWRVELEGFEPTRTVELCERSLSVSAPHGRTTLREGRELGHVLDPQTGAALEPGLRVAALAASGREAEAWSTASVVLLARGLDPRDLAPAHIELHASAAAPHSSLRHLHSTPT
jgi:thiamine biosynthesis lipoprotein